MIDVRLATGGAATAVVPALVMLGALLFVPSCSRNEPAPNRPNILLITLCSVRADHMSLYGYQRQTTPNLDAVARESIVFENAFTQWPKTAPAFAAIFTGKYGHSTGIMRVTPNQRLDDQHETLAELLRSHGYETGAFNSTGVLNDFTNILQGFDTVEHTWELYSPQSFPAATRRALEWIRKPRKSPFFAWVHYNNAHQPYTPVGVQPDLFVGDAFYDPAKRVEVNLRPLRMDAGILQHPYAQQIIRPDIGGAHPSAVLEQNPNELDFYIAQYDAAVLSTDAMIGELLFQVRALGLLDSTVVVVVSDHGESMGDHDYFFGHGRLPYNDCARVPLLLRPPGGVAEPKRIGAPVAAFSVAPTLLEMAAVDAPDAMEATSLLPIMQRQAQPPPVFMESGYQLDFTLSVFQDQWKLIRVPSDIERQWTKGTEYELYNLAEDPGELRNLYTAEPQVAGRLRAILDEWAAPWVAEAYETVGTLEVKLDPKLREHLKALGYLP